MRVCACMRCVRVCVCVCVCVCVSGRGTHALSKCMSANQSINQSNYLSMYLSTCVCIKCMGANLGTRKRRSTPMEGSITCGTYLRFVSSQLYSIFLPDPSACADRSKFPVYVDVYLYLYIYLSIYIYRYIDTYIHL